MKMRVCMYEEILTDVKRAQFRSNIRQSSCIDFLVPELNLIGEFMKKEIED